jgi:DNA-binding NarL/FixJ family response regulator
VNKEVGKIMRKMNATSRTAACIAAIRSNLIF